MEIYLPIAEISVSLPVILLIGAAIGMISGFFGIGGAFLTTPLLIFIGIPPYIAAATAVTQVVGTSLSGTLANLKNDNVDIKMASVMLCGGLIGSTAGVFASKILSLLGYIDVIISILYIIILGIIGSSMFYETIQLIYLKKNTTAIKKSNRFLLALPFKMIFPKSKLYISFLAPLLLMLIINFIAAIMGIGGGFIMIPVMIYLLGMPTQLALGTSLFQVIFTSANTTFFQASLNQSVDIILAIFLVLGSTLGMPFATKLSRKFNSDYLRFFLSLLILGICFQLIYTIIFPPQEIFTLEKIH